MKVKEVDNVTIQTWLLEDYPQSKFIMKEDLQNWIMLINDI